MHSGDLYSIHIEVRDLTATIASCLKEFCLIEDYSSQTVGYQDYREAELYLDSIEMYFKGTCITSSTDGTPLGRGVVHLYKGQHPTLPHAPSSAKTSSDDLGTVLAILAVPSYMTSADLLGFFGESLQQISHTRILRTDDLRRYLVLLKFRSKHHAQTFQEKFNGAIFNSMEPETVHCVSIESITFCGKTRLAEDFPKLTTQAEEGSRPIVRQGLKAMPPVMTLTELPTCVVCLERMDATTTGLLTIACEHTFHCSCLSKWVNTQATCPICRFSVARDVLKESQKHCLAPDCTSKKNLWMCLICGNINCGRYESQHAINHFNISQHAFAMDLDSGRIWDYSSDSYVHRLLEDKIGASSMMAKQDTRGKHDDNSGEEFEELLAAQLESQRLYYEDQVSTAVNRSANAVSLLQVTETSVKRLEAQLQETQSLLQRQQLESQNLRHSQTRLEGKSKIISDLARQSKKQVEEEQSINGSLMTRISHLESSLAQSEHQRSAMQKEVSDLKEQVRDLMIHFASVNTIGQLDSGELADAQISVPTNDIDASKTGKSRRRANKKKGNKVLTQTSLPD